MPQKTATSCNWVPSIVTENTLKDFVKMATYQQKMSCIGTPPIQTNKDLSQRMMRSLFLLITWIGASHRPVLNFSETFCTSFNSTLKILVPIPYPISAIYLQEEPTVELFREYFYLNRQNEFTNGPSLELGRISIQRRRDAIFPYACFPSHPKDWNQTWFYYKDTSPADENPLPGYCAQRLD